MKGVLSFGTNEELPFDFLDNNIKFTKVTEAEYQLFKKCNIQGHYIMDHFFYALDSYLDKHLDDYNNVDSDEWEDIWEDEYELTTFQMLIDMAVENDNKN